MDNGIEDYALRHKKLHPELVAFLGRYFDIDLKTVRIKPTRLTGSIYALGGTVLFRRRTLNAKYDPPTNRGVDLSAPGGMRIMAHELFHIQQWRRGRIRFAWSWLGGLFRYLRGAKWHDSRLEQEAISFSKKIAPSIRGRTQELEWFATAR